MRNFSTSNNIYNEFYANNYFNLAASFREIWHNRVEWSAILKYDNVRLLNCVTNILWPS